MYKDYVLYAACETPITQFTLHTIFNIGYLAGRMRSISIHHQVFVSVHTCMSGFIKTKSKESDVSILEHVHNCVNWLKMPQERVIKKERQQKKTDIPFSFYIVKFGDSFR